jgi:hypothetical protein
LGRQYTIYAAFFPTLWEFCEIRKKIKDDGFQPNLISDFQEKHGENLIRQLKPAFDLVREYVSTKR